MRTKIKDIMKKKPVGSEVKVCGWVKTIRNQKKFAFIEINDGSIFTNLQIIIDHTNPDFSKIEEINTGVSLSIQGKVVESPGKVQKVELQCTSLRIYGKADPEEYPLQKKRHSFEFLRSIAHLRPRTNTQGAVIRVRNAIAYASHIFFQEKGFCYIQTPIITGSDCEGAGELFQVTTLSEKILKKPNESIDYSKDFFEKKAFLTVSGQLEAEALSCAMSDVYTFGPTFRAENSHTSRHLAEFWMIEPEIAFADLQDDMQLAEEYLKFIIHYVMKNCEEDLSFFDKFIEKGLLLRLQNVLESPFLHLSYSEAVKILKNAKKTFEFPVEWGADLQSEHERYLTEEYAKKPIIVTDYPEMIKAFYMRINDDQETVAAMDVLVPKVGEIIGGSQREERLDVLKERIKKTDLPLEDYWWYLDLRQFGTVPHAGFGAGFERLVQFITGMENIRDVIPFPRYPGHVEF